MDIDEERSKGVIFFGRFKLFNINFFCLEFKRIFLDLDYNVNIYWDECIVEVEKEI